MTARQRFLAVLFLSLFLIGFAFGASGPPPDSKDQAILLALKAAWGPSAPVSWVKGRDCSTWAGVVCDSQNRVFQLYLTGVTGKILPAIGGLSHLTLLYLQDGGLQGPLPATLGDLKALEALDLTGNKLSGSIPSSLCKLKSLVSLRLTTNQLSGSIPACLYSLPALGWLEVGSNRLTGVISPAIKNLGLKIRRLDASNNRLSGTFPQAIRLLGSLEELKLGFNQLSGRLPACVLSGQMKNLSWLDLSGNRFSGGLPQHCFSGLPSLGALFLGSNLLEGPLPATISDSPVLKILGLGSNRFNGSIPGPLGNPKTLFELQLQGNRLTGTVPKSFSSFAVLAYLDLSHNFLTGSLPQLVGDMQADDEEPRITILAHDNYFTGSPEMQQGPNRICPPGDESSNQRVNVTDNCLLGDHLCDITGTQPQRSAAKCADFCGTKVALCNSVWNPCVTPPCGGHGTCAPTFTSSGTNSKASTKERLRWFSCVCDAGYKVAKGVSGRFQCVPFKRGSSLP